MTSQNKTPKRTISIRLGDDLLDRLDRNATQYAVSRTEIIESILQQAIDTWSPAAAPVPPETVSGAIEDIRLELTEIFERLDRLDRVAAAAAPTPTPTETEPAIIAAAPTETLTTGQLCDRYGWTMKNAARSAKRLGWVPVGKSGRETVWRNTPQYDA